MLTNSLRSLLKEATSFTRQASDDDDHTVGATLLTKSGRTIHGLNAYHFLGGPCGEITALANHAAACPNDPIEAIVAIYGPTGDVIPPCGKCRQVLYDIDPSIKCIIRGSNGFESKTVTELLPHSFDWKELETPQKIFMWEGYEAAIRNGSKEQTIRIDDPFYVGTASLVFEKENGMVTTLPAQVTAVVQTQRCKLTEEDACNDGFQNLAELHSALDFHYPELGPNDPVDVVTFKLAD